MKKLVGILVCTLLIATALPAVGIMNVVKNNTVSSKLLCGFEWSREHHYEFELFDDCNKQHVETLSQFHNYVTYDNIDTFIIDIMDKFHIPGLSASIVKDGNVFWTESYGYANITQSVYVQDTTLFIICSISKTVTATAIMQLYEQGYFDLDDPINDYLPFQVIHPDYPSVDITFHMLLTHTSGIKDNQAVMPVHAGDSPNPLGQWLEDYLTPGGQYYDPDENFLNSEPGTDWEYCNAAVGLVGYLVEVISEYPFDEYCEINIFEPLDMNESAWFLADLDINHIAVPYSWNGYEYVPYPHPGRDSYPAGTLRTSVSQLNNFLMMMMNNGEYNSTQILKENTVDLMLSPQLPFYQTQGIIWYKVPFGGRTFWRHYGGLPGARTVISIYPETNNGVIVLTNGECSQTILSKISDELFDFVESPYAPDIDGTPSGTVGTEYEYTFKSVDPDDDDVKYHLDWGDDSFDTTGFNSSGSDVKVSHTWSKKGTYTIIAYAEDTHGLVGPNATITVTMPRTKTSINSCWLRFFDMFPILQGILLQRLG